MTSCDRSPILPEHLQAIVRRIAAAGALVRKNREGWTIIHPHSANHPPEPLAAEIASALLARGHLVPRAGGGYQTLQQSMASSPRLASHRPSRPVENAAAPSLNEAESPLAWLRARKGGSGQPLISEAQFLAGERLRADYERGCMGARTTANWDPSATAGRSGGNMAGHITDQALAARLAFHGALDHVGPELSGILVQVCCMSAGLEQAERVLEMPQRSGKAVLGLALTRLARHYGLLQPVRRTNTSTSQWGLPGYRPEIPPQAAP